MFIKPSASNMFKQRWQRALSKIVPYAIPKSKNCIGAQFRSHYLTILDIKITFSLISNIKKILNSTSDPIIIQTLLCSFVTFFEHLLLNI